MADISKELNTIRKNRYGHDIRHAIADGLEKLNNAIETVYFAYTHLNTALDNINSEITEIKNNNKSMSNNISSIGTNIDVINKEIEGLKEKINKLENNSGGSEKPPDIDYEIVEITQQNPVVGDTIVIMPGGAQNKKEYRITVENIETPINYVFTDEEAENIIDTLTSTDEYAFAYVFLNMRGYLKIDDNGIYECKSGNGTRHDEDNTMVFSYNENQNIKVIFWWNGSKFCYTVAIL